MVSAPSALQPKQKQKLTNYDPTPWPAKTLQRVGIRALLSLPLVSIAIAAAADGWASQQHLLLVARADVIAANQFPLEALGIAYPPAPTFIAWMFGSTVGLAIVSSFLAGSALHSAIERLVRRQVPLGLIVLIVATVTLVPVFWYLATQDLATVGSIAMLVIAMEGFVRFAFGGETDGGFTAGLFLAVAFLFDPNVIAYAIALSLAAPLLAYRRYHGEPAAIRATVAVLCFPVIAAVVSWAFLEWQFAGTVFASWRDDFNLFVFPDGVIGTLFSAAAVVGEGVLRTPLFLVVGALLVARNAIASVGYALPLVAMTLNAWVGLTDSVTILSIMLILTFVAMITVPFQPDRRTQFLIGTAAIAQIVINDLWPPVGEGFVDSVNLFFT